MSLDLDIDQAQIPSHIKDLLHELLYRIEDLEARAPVEKPLTVIHTCDHCAMYVPKKE